MKKVGLPIDFDCQDAQLDSLVEALVKKITP
jgi:hypothetical protein